MRRLVDHLLTGYLLGAHPGLYAVLTVTGIAEQQVRAADPAIHRPDVTLRIVHWDRLPLVTSDPEGLAEARVRVGSRPRRRGAGRPPRSVGPLDQGAGWHLRPGPGDRSGPRSSRARSPGAAHPAQQGGRLAGHVRRARSGRVAAGARHPGRAGPRRGAVHVRRRPAASSTSVAAGPSPSPAVPTSASGRPRSSGRRAARRRPSTSR